MSPHEKQQPRTPPEGPGFDGSAPDDPHAEVPFEELPLDDTKTKAGTPAAQVPEPGPLEGSVSPRARGKGEHPLCVLCRADVLAAGLSCPGCAAVVHADCAHEITTCPTLGCQRSARDMTPVRRTATRSPQQKPAAFGAGLLVWVAFLVAINFLPAAYRAAFPERGQHDWVERHAQDAAELGEALAELEGSERGRVLNALEALGSDGAEAAPALTRLALDDTAYVAHRGQALRILARLDGPNAVAVVETVMRRGSADGSFLRSCQAALDDLGQEASTLGPALEQHARDHPQDSRTVVQLLAKVAPQRAEALLIEALRAGPEPEVQIQFLSSLSDLPLEATFAVVAEATRSEDVGVRALAFDRMRDLLGSSQDARAYEVLQRAFEEGGRDTQAALEALRRDPSPDRSRALFQDLLQHESPWIRELSAGTLGYMNAQAARAALQARVDDEREDPRVRERARDAIRRLDDWRARGTETREHPRQDRTSR